MESLSILQRLKRHSPQEFEVFVLEFLKNIQNSIEGEVTGQTGDGGVDGWIRMDKLRLGDVYFQAKKWDSTVVGRPEIQKFVGALHGKRAVTGVFVTTSSFSKGAHDYVKLLEKNVRLIDGLELEKLIVENHLLHLVKEESALSPPSLTNVVPDNRKKQMDGFSRVWELLQRDKVFGWIFYWFSKLSPKVKGIIVILMFVGLWGMFHPHPPKHVENKPTIVVDNRPKLPITINYRNALLSGGLVAKFENLSSHKLKFVAVFTNPNLAVSKAFNFSLRPIRVLNSDIWKAGILNREMRSA